ncbi:hypothetical protein [Achromobacter sp. AGC39]
MLDLASIPIYMPAKPRSVVLATGWQPNYGMRPKLKADQRMNVRFNDGRVEAEHPGCVWDGEQSQNPQFVGFYQIETLMREPDGSSVAETPAGVATTGPDVGSW